jgi:hypothetical protein
MKSRTTERALPKVRDFAGTPAAAALAPKNSGSVTPTLPMPHISRIRLRETSRIVERWDSLGGREFQFRTLSVCETVLQG